MARALDFAFRAVSGAALTTLVGCGAGVPLLHGAHALPPGKTMTTAGFSGTFTSGAARDAIDRARDPEATAGRERLAADYEAVTRALAPAVAPFVGMRVGLAGDNEVGLSFNGRLLRLDARHAFESGPWALSLGAGGRWTWSAPAAAAESDPQTTTSQVLAYGCDAPLLVGWQSAAGVVSLWAGARGGLERYADRSSNGIGTALDLTHWHAGGVAGLKIGFRHVHAAIELETAYHGVKGNVGISNVELSGVTLTPAGGLLFTF